MVLAYLIKSNQNAWSIKKITKGGMRSSLTAYAVSPAFVAVGMGPGLLALVAGADVFFLLSPRFSFDIAQT